MPSSAPVYNVLIIKTGMRVLFVVISSHNAFYDVLRNYWEWVCESASPDVDVRFVYYSSEADNDVTVDGRNIIFRGKETYVPGIFNKTMAAFDRMNAASYDWVVRTNLSTFFDLRTFTHALHALDKDTVYAPMVWCHKHLFNAQTFPVGFCIIMSGGQAGKVERFVRDADQPAHTLTWPDDVRIGFIMDQLDVRVVELRRIFQFSSHRSLAHLKQHLSRKKSVSVGPETETCVYRVRTGHGKTRTDSEVQERMHKDIPMWAVLLEHHCPGSEP